MRKPLETSGNVTKVYVVWSRSWNFHPSLSNTEAVLLTTVPDRRCPLGRKGSLQMNKQTNKPQSKDQSYSIPLTAAPLFPLTWTFGDTVVLF